MKDVKKPCLLVVATPIGNLGDITRRAEQALKQADVIAAEDTRVTRKLLSHLGVSARLISCHKHNERQCLEEIISLLEAGRVIALVSDAGTPLISDPGSGLVERVRQAGFPVIPVPGPCAAVCALSAAGIREGRFFFQGFLPPKGPERKKALKEMAAIGVPVVLYESPHRIKRTLEDIAEALGNREIFSAREMTKLHEEYGWHSVEGMLAELERRGPRGEYTLIVMPEKAPVPRSAEMDSELEALLETISCKRKPGMKRLSKLLSRLTGRPSGAIYNRLAELKREMEDGSRDS
jgi:16S rRNA (cytidine1402-2'-O)-methyltransferase